MTKYFAADTVRQAADNMRQIDSKWLLIPLVFAANGVTEKAKVKVADGPKKTTTYLKQFFDGSLIGLEPRRPGGHCNIRPGNAYSDGRKIEQPVHVDYSPLWDKTYSQAGYKGWQDGRILAHKHASDNGHFQLGPKFAAELRSHVDPKFCFEDLLVWLYAFSGMPDSVNGWNDLMSDFSAHHMGTGAIPKEYSGVFRLTSPPPPWPTTVATRPTNEEFQLTLVPHLGSVEIKPEQLADLRDALQAEIREHYLEFTDPEVGELADSIVSSLHSCRRIFLYGDPGTGKTQLARIIASAFEDVFAERTHVVFAPVADSSSADKLVGFSTLDGTWVPGILTQRDKVTGLELLYDEASKLTGRRQVSVLILDEANRRDIEEILVKFQTALDSESADPAHDDFRVALDNSGERRMAPNVFLVMTGNSPREDSGRVVQSRPFKRRHNFLPVENVFRRVLAKDGAAFSTTLGDLWDKVGPAMSLDPIKHKEFGAALIAPTNSTYMEQVRDLLRTLDSHAIGVSFGLVKKALKTAATRFSLGAPFAVSIDAGLTESVFSLLSAESPVDGRGSIKDSLDATPVALRGALPRFFSMSDALLRGPDALGRVRPFL